ncbi:MAG: RDD family protein [Actinobacteria bacterium]|uniref:RDD family protein n=1 Tax=Candidatus Fonsibacter lacus TaxID=2576439 RepID=A0A965GC41_9PROT|nr:RDD family protein [Candidatus Fonsibacter lacus]
MSSSGGIGSESDDAPGLRLASLWRKLFALCLDWLASSVIARLLVSEQQRTGWVTLAIFFLEVALFTILLGGSAGQVVAGIRIVDIDTGMKIGVLAALIRSALICLVIPPILSINGRGLHDRAVRSVAIVNV